MGKALRFTLLLLLMSVLLTGTAFAEGNKETTSTTQAAVWPAGPVSIVVSSRAGGFADIHARILADYLQRTTSTAFAVLNIAEGGGSVGAEKVRTSKPDGLMLYYMHTSFPISTYTGVYKADPDKDFTSISSVVNAGNNAYVVRVDAPWNNLDDLFADARKRPNEIMWGSMAGATSHFVMAIFEREGNVKFKMVDAGSEAEKITALLGGHIDIANVGMSNADQYVKSGKMKVLAITGEERDFAFPQYPTAVEQGYNIVWNGEFMLYGPSGIPSDVVARINEVLNDFGTKDQVSKDALAKQGAYVTERTTEESVKFMKDTHAMLKSMSVELGF